MRLRDRFVYGPAVRSRLACAASGRPGCTRSPLTFNVGVELGQLPVVGAAYLLYRALAARPGVALARAPALYAIAAVAVYWSIGRIVGILA